MTPEQKQLVQNSFAQVQPISDTTAAVFYGRLFTLDPDLEPLFKGDIEEQGKKLMRMIGLAVKGLDRLDELVPMLHQLGARHADYGVAERHYETVAAALLWTLEQGLGDAFTPDVRDAWTAVYALLAETMKAGATEGAIGCAPQSPEAVTSHRGSARDGWGEYLPATSPMEPDPMPETPSRYQRLTGRYATTLESW